MPLCSGQSSSSAPVSARFTSVRSRCPTMSTSCCATGSPSSECWPANTGSEMPVPLDEYPIHQTPLSMQYVGTSDRNFYDRSYFNAHDRTGDVFLLSGLGVYANLGVIDAYASVRRGDQQWSVRFS